MTEWVGDHPVETLDDAEPHLAGIQRSPVKSLDPERPDSATLFAAGALAGDRQWAIVDRPAPEPYDPEDANVTGRGDYVNSKKTAAVQRLRSTFVPSVIARRSTARPVRGRDRRGRPRRRRVRRH